MRGMEFRQERHIGDILKERNIILKGADAATSQGLHPGPELSPQIEEAELPATR